MPDPSSGSAVSGETGSRTSEVRRDPAQSEAQGNQVQATETAREGHRFSAQASETAPCVRVGVACDSCLKAFTKPEQFSCAGRRESGILDGPTV